MRMKKSLGQNFLKSRAALLKMVSSGAIGASDTVLEIGPGKGALTKELLATGARVVAVEKDDRLIPYLLGVFEKEHRTGQFVLFHGDALEFSPEKWIPGSYKLVANIPYYITGMLIRGYLECSHPPTGMTILVQKEVAERIVAKDGKESLLSLSVKYYGTPSYKGVVSKRYFSPVPKVDSAIIHIGNIQRAIGATAEQKGFFALIHQAFAHKRKTLMHNLAPKYGRPKIESACLALAISPIARAETIPVETWRKMAELLS